MINEKTGIKNEAAKAVALPFREIVEIIQEAIPEFDLSDEDAFYACEDCNIVIEHTMAAYFQNWGVDNWKVKCKKYFIKYKGNSRPTYIICTTNYNDHRDTKVIPNSDIHVCAVFKILLDGVEEILDELDPPNEEGKGRVDSLSYTIQKILKH